MAMEKDPLGNPDEDVRRRALTRLGMAGLVTAVALAGLWWLDQGSQQADKPIPPRLTTPIVSAPLQASAPPLVEPVAEAETPVEETAPPEPEPPAAAAPPAAPPVVHGARSEPPPPPKVSNAQRPVSPPVPATPAPATPASTTPAPRSPAPSPAAQVPARTAPAVAAARPAQEVRPAQAARPQPAAGAPQPAVAEQRFVVQLGVYSDPVQAGELVEKLRRRGVRAHMETRVQLGPFANRAEAEKAQAEMRRMGLSAAITAATK